MKILQFVLLFLIWHSLIFSQEACMCAAVFQFVLASLLHLWHQLPHSFITISEQCRPICVRFTTALLCLAQPPIILAIHLLLKNEGVMLLHSEFENPDLL